MCFKCGKHRAYGIEFFYGTPPAGNEKAKALYAAIPSASHGLRRFGTVRENALIAADAVRRLLEANSALLAYLVLKQWLEIVTAALEPLKGPALDDFQRFFTGTADVHGVEVSTRNSGSAWKYPAEIITFEREVERMKEQLKSRKKVAETDGSATKQRGEAVSLVVTFRA